MERWREAVSAWLLLPFLSLTLPGSLEQGRPASALLQGCLLSWPLPTVLCQPQLDAASCFCTSTPSLLFSSHSHLP